jgi:hypothetical protein
MKVYDSGPEKVRTLQPYMDIASRVGKESTD